MTFNAKTPIVVSPGDCVFVDVSVAWGAVPVRHLGIVTDAVGLDGHLRVISNSARRGGVYEEEWRTFAQGLPVHRADLTSTLPPDVTLERARRREGTRYDGAGYNCEHFVRESFGLPVKSPQVRRAGYIAGGIMAAIGAVAAYIGGSK